MKWDYVVCDNAEVPHIKVVDAADAGKLIAELSDVSLSAQSFVEGVVERHNSDVACLEMNLRHADGYPSC